MKPGDVVRNKNSKHEQTGLFMGMRIFKGREHPDYTCAEVMWFNKTAPNGDIISTIQLDLVEVVKEITK